uniref:Uncharacterized protein n=1 Tax=Strombidium cf. sulcatum TaxID=2793073 RepID=A0A7T0M4N7_9SPIT|nr:hypothetical protein J6674_mgp26 [Strombidium cf. sulcatum]QPL15963.1 hypothetical protein [Strombidium cf. sulcatum]
MYNSTLETVFNGGRWLSGRKRQTVNLLGNPRWFESNSSHIYNKYFGLYKDYLSKKLINIEIKKKSWNTLSIYPNNIQYKLNKYNFKVKSSLLPHKNLINYNNFIIKNTIFSTFTKLKIPTTSYLFRRKYLLNLVLSNYTLYKDYYLYNRVPYLKKKITALGVFHSEKTLLLNFLRYRFFPTIHDFNSTKQYLYLSLGMVSWRFKQSKAFRKNKMVFLLLSNFLRKILLYSSIKRYMMVIRKIPIYFKEILNTLTSPTIAPYTHPFFKKKTVEERFYKNPFYFSHILFFNNKPYGSLKLKKRGRLKRKITKKIVSINRITD